VRVLLLHEFVPQLPVPIPHDQAGVPKSGDPPHATALAIKAVTNAFGLNDKLILVKKVS
jgi:hypothetical protein